MDNIPLSATNAAGGTRVIGVGCRYYTTLRRGVFIDEITLRIAQSNEPTFAVKTAVPSYTICADSSWVIPSTQIGRWLYHLCVQRGYYITCALCWVTVRYTIFLGGVYCVRLPFSRIGGGVRLRVPIGGLYNAVIISRSFFAPSNTVHAV